MFKNFITLAYRNLIRNKAFSTINICGLAIGMASAILIFLWVQDELGYDRFYKNSDRLYQSWIRGKGKNGIGCSPVTPKILGLALKQQRPEVEQISRVNWDEAMLLTVGEKRLNIGIQGPLHGLANHPTTAQILISITQMVTLLKLRACNW